LIDRYQAYANSYADILELEFVDRAATAARAGMALDAPALWLADAGIVDAGALCRTWLGHHGIKVHPAATVQQLQRGANDWQVITDQRVLHADTVVLACGSASPLFERWLPFPLDRAAGRLTRVRGNSELSRLKTVVCADAYITPALGNSGEHAIGATWSLGNVTVEAASADAENIVGLKRALGTTTSDCRVTGGMTGVRLLSPDRLPLLGEIDDGLFVNLAHGSRGVTTSWLSGDIVAAMINAEPLPITNRVARAALATRHVRR
jgi:tRNA 5-methylaminomethyl-2-thiouridine biosynthesis bifunctional protein